MMVISQFHPPNNLPIISLMIQDGNLVALDWYEFKMNKLLHRLGQTATRIAADKLNQADKNQAVAIQAINELGEYFLGNRQSFEVPLALYGTPFQRQVWQTLQAIPYGQTISYAQLAAKIGKPTAYRACANANGKNPISLIVPCHRVIGSDGGLGGYTGGLDIKKTLLQLEGLDC